MRSIKRFLVLICLLWISAGTETLPGQEKGDLTRKEHDRLVKKQDVPTVIGEGMQAYKEGDADAALETWVGKGPFENTLLNTTLRREYFFEQRTALHKIEALYGPFKTHHVIFVQRPSATTRFVYAVMDFEAGPAFAKFVAFHGEEGWYVVRFKFDVDAETVWPPSLLEGPKSD